METKSLLFGLIGFFAGGLLVSVAATTFDTPELQKHDSMSAMTQTLTNKTGAEYDAEFAKQMIMHHEAAVDMAELSGERTANKDVLTLSDEIISAQKQEIERMKRWGLPMQDMNHSH